MLLGIYCTIIAISAFQMNCRPTSQSVISVGHSNFCPFWPRTNWGWLKLRILLVQNKILTRDALQAPAWRAYGVASSYWEPTCRTKGLPRRLAGTWHHMSMKNKLPSLLMGIHAPVLLFSA